MTGRPALLLATILATLLATAPARAAEGAAEPPSLDGAAAILIDARDGEVLYAKNPDERRSIASTTKLMTALLALERAEPDEELEAADYRAAPVESKIDLRPGERMRVDDLIEALLLESANDAAATLAEGISGSRREFVAEMNRRAAELGLLDTSYANPIGLDDPVNHSTARDLAALARRLLLGDPRFARIVDMPSATLESGSRPRVVANRNDLIASFPFVDGVKTGYTNGAGYVLVGSATAASGAHVISVVLGASSEAARDADSIALLRYGLGQFQLVPVLRPRRQVATAEVEYYDRRVALVPRRAASVLVRRGERLDKRISAPEEVRGELAAGEPVGRVAVLRDGVVVRRIGLVVADRVPGAGLPRRIVSTLGLGLTLAVLLVMVSAVAFAGMRLTTRRASRGQVAPSRASAAEPDPKEPVGDR